MKRKLLTIAVTALLVGMAGHTAEVLAAKGSPGPPPGKGKGGGEDPTAVNRLSYPALLVPGVSVTPFFNVGTGGTFNSDYSYGCEGVEIVYVGGTKFTYPNTSCVSGWNDDGSAVSFLTAEQCTDDVSPSPCQGKPVDRIYWQKKPNNLWSAEAVGISSGLPVVVGFVDWGDSIESVSWNENSILRVETQVYADFEKRPRSEVLPNPPETVGALTRYEMWHSQGQGINEQWGVRTKEDLTPYSMEWPYAIVNAGTATLYLSKLVPGGDSVVKCPEVKQGDENGSVVYPPEYTDDFPKRLWYPGDGWENACNLDPVDFTVELSVTGKYVHGYNWRMRDMDAVLAKTCPGWSKTGWWRLTFVPNGVTTKVDFDNPIRLVPPPPTTPAEATLYSPVVADNLNLSYIDICIVSKAQGGGRK